MQDLIEVRTTCACQETARELGRKLIDARLAACVQITGPIESIFRWEGEVRSDQEWHCTIKSTRPLTERLIEFITKHHPYEVPEILVTSVIQSSAGYANWVQAEVREPQS